MSVLSKIEKYLGEQIGEEPQVSYDDQSIEDLMIGLINSLEDDKLTDEQIATKNDIVAHLNRDNI